MITYRKFLLKYDVYVNYKVGFKYYAKVVRCSETQAVAESFKNQGWKLDSRRTVSDGLVALTFSKRENREESESYNRFDRILSWDTLIDEPVVPEKLAAEKSLLGAFLAEYTQDFQSVFGLDYEEAEMQRTPEPNRMPDMAERLQNQRRQLNNFWEATQEDLDTWVRQSRDRSHNQ